MVISEINKTEKYVVLAPSNIHCFNKILKDWSENIIQKAQLETFEKDLIPTLCVNKIPENIGVDTIKNTIVSYGLHPEMSIGYKENTETQ